ncbi:MAG: hypothetical protein KDE28_22345, partial [Anaerolineales bacterium]|nr:hypothetical protein [Anaerolineales bacterium]
MGTILAIQKAPRYTKSMRRLGIIERALRLPWRRWLAGFIGLLSLVACQVPANPAAPTPWVTRPGDLITPPPTSPVTRESQPVLPQAMASPTSGLVNAATSTPPVPTANP